jgi:hypothetical protein
LSSIKVSLSCEIINSTTKKTEHFSAHDSFDIFTHDDSDRMFQLADAYLRKVQGNYSVLFLGKNGEPQAEKLIECTFKHRVEG